MLYALLCVGASARIVMQIVAMPPYSGLDEIQHVAHLAFVDQEERSPTTREPSIPLYLDASIHQKATALPSFAQIGERWPEVVRANPHLLVARLLQPDDQRPHVERNYEAQQPAFFYMLATPFVSRSSAVSELRSARFVAGALALVTVLGTAAAGDALFGASGIAAAAMLLFLPTRMTLVIRVANDSLACAFVAVAFAVTVRDPQTWIGWIGEGLLWAGALATKLYTWPLAVLLPWLWWRQRAGGKPVITVSTIAATAVALTHFRSHSSHQQRVWRGRL